MGSRPLLRVPFGDIPSRPVVLPLLRCGSWSSGQGSVVVHVRVRLGGSGGMLLFVLRDGQQGVC